LLTVVDPYGRDFCSKRDHKEPLANRTKRPQLKLQRERNSVPRQSAAAYIVPNISGSPERLKPPGDLTPIERAIFVEIVAGCKADHFRPSDLPLLAAYCAAIALEREAITRLREDGRVIDGRVNPWLSVLAQAHKSMLAFSHRLRLSPQGRSPTNPSRPERALSYYERQAIEEGKAG
jgi:phage terminase small subunit